MASLACERVLKKRAAHNHLLIRTRPSSSCMGAILLSCRNRHEIGKVMQYGKVQAFTWRALAVGLGDGEQLTYAEVMRGFQYGLAVIDEQRIGRMKVFTRLQCWPESGGLLGLAEVM